jgi:hypothetical protein
MPNADTYADYQVLSGGQHTLDAATSASEVEFDFSIADNIVVTNGNRRPILAFHARVHKQTMLKVFINSQQVLSWTLGTDLTVKGLWCPWPAGTVLLQPSEVEKVRFSVSQTGKIDIENVVMWYQVRDEH